MLSLPTIRNRARLILLVSIGQLICLLVGVLLFSSWLKRDFERLVRKEVVAGNERYVTQLADFLEEIQPHEMEQGKDGWNTIQKFVESNLAPRDGFVTIFNRKDGSILNHPDLRTNPNLEDDLPKQVILQTKDGDTTIRESLAESGGLTSGMFDLDGKPHFLTAHELPNLEAVLIIYQLESKILDAIDDSIEPMRIMAVILSILLVAASGVTTALIVRQYENRLAGVNENLEDLVEKRSHSLLNTRNAVIFGLAKLSEARDHETGNHLERIMSYVEVLAEELSRENPDLIDPDQVETLGLASSLHDIGKVGIPDAVLCKPGKLTEEEREIIKQHPVIGGECLLALKRKLGEDDFLTNACQIAFAHHEKWDGSGYPFQLAGEDIALSARLTALADVYDALTCRRVYKPPMSHEEAKEIILKDSGKHFDPEVVRIFLKREADFIAIAERLAV